MNKYIRNRNDKTSDLQITCIVVLYDCGLEQPELPRHQTLVTRRTVFVGSLHDASNGSTLEDTGRIV